MDKTEAYMLQISAVVLIIVGGTLIGWATDWRIGGGVAAIAYALLPVLKVRS